MNRSSLILPLLLLGFCACDGHQDAAAPAAVDETTTAPQEAPAAPEASAAPVGPISGHAGLIDPAPNSQQAAGAAASIGFDLPKGWESKPPTSSMRLAQATIPGTAGPADFAVFYFGPGGGGSVDANVKRWVGQMEGAAPPKPEVFETNGYKVTWIDVKGTMKPSGMGMGPSTAVPDARLFGAVVEGPSGPWFFKAQGPDSTLGPQHDAFVALLKSVRSKK